MSGDLILAINAGSSSLKFAVYDDAPSLSPLMKGSVGALHDAPRLQVAYQDRRPKIDERLGYRPLDGPAALDRVLAVLRRDGLVARVTLVGHRIVHGGHEFTRPTRLDPVTLDALEQLVPLAPLHQPFNLALVRVAAEALPDALHVGGFDTAFHATAPRLARLYGLPRELSDAGVVAYGFHGLSYAYIASALRTRDSRAVPTTSKPEPGATERTIVAHLGSGVSLCAILGGQSVATTMGFSVLDGPPMSTRSGSLDPAVVLYLIQQRGMSAEDVSALLYHHAGLLGVSGSSGDLSLLVDLDDPHAREAVELFVYRVGREIGSLVAALGGLDRLVFTAGVGEHVAPIRAGICAHAAWLGVQLDEARNARHAEVISTDDSRVEVLVIPTDEEHVLAEGARTCRESGRV